MGEVDTKPIESVQAALSLFGGKSDQRKYRSLSSEIKQRPEKDAWEVMVTDLANYKVQLEVKEYAYNQALLKIESYHITVDELYGQLKNCEVERDQFIEHCREVRTQVENLELRVKEMSDLLQEAGNTQEELLLVINELNATREELHNVKADLAACDKSKASALTKVELYENAVKLERQKTKEEMCEQMDIMQELEDQLLSKTILAEYYHMELKQAKELHYSTEQAASDANDHMNQLKLQLELVERTNSDRASYIEVIDTEVLQLQSQLQTEKEGVDHLKLEIDTLTGEIHKTKTEMDEVSERQSEAQVEIALLNAEIHKGRSKIAAAEAGEARAKSAKAGLYLAVKQLAIEAEEAKNETKILKLDTDNTEDLETNGLITISVEEYESLINKSQTVSQPEASNMLEVMKKQLEEASLDIEELRSTAEEAADKAEQAERAKSAIENQLRKWREHKQKKRDAAITALREELVSARSTPTPYNKFPTPYPVRKSDPPKRDPAKYNKASTPYQPLFKVLNMKL